MRLDVLIRDLPCELVRGTAAQEITTIAEDSRDVLPGDLFIAREGTVTDGNQFIADALTRGAVAVLTSSRPPLPASATLVIAEDVPTVAAAMAERLAGEPGRSLRLVGVTGTNGKTTIAHLVQQIVRHAGSRCGLIGTVVTDDGREHRASELTTPGAVDLSRTLARMVANGCDACVMEVSSHALEQRRTAGLTFEGAVFSNLTGDHLDFHGTAEAYAAAKRRLFALVRSDGWAVVNADDPASVTMADACPGEVITTTLGDGPAACRAVVLDATIDGLRARLDGPWGSIETDLALTGRHNLSNVLQATAVACLLGLDRDRLVAALPTCVAPPGRLERVPAAEADVRIFVDYAHTDDALENVLSALRPLVPGGRKLIVVFGCGGDRDRTKRPRMALAACAYGDEVIITSDNPRTEDPAAIVDEVFRGVPSPRRRDTACIVDRSEAIQEAIRRGNPGDVVLIAGKGHENYQIVGTRRRHFDDREVAAEAARRWSAAGGGNE